MPFCVNCGNQLDDSARFCARCGAKVTPIAPVAEAPVIIAPSIDEPTYKPAAVEEPAAPVYEAPVYEEPEEATVYFPPVTKAPVQQEPVYQEPAYQEPVYQEPVYQEPVHQEPVRQEPVYQEPVYQAPAEPVYVPPVPKAEKVSLVQKKPLGIFKKILVVFLCLLAFVFASATVVSFCARSTITGENIADLIDLVDLSDMKAETIIGDAKRSDSMAEWLRDQLLQRSGIWEAMSVDELETYLETFIIPFAKEEVSEFAEVLLTGKGKASITIEEVRELIEGSADYLEKEHGILLTDRDVDDLVKWIDGFGISEKASTKYLEKEFGDILDIARLVLSWAAVAVFGALTLLMLVLILITNKSLIRNLNSTGIVAVLVGTLFGVAALVNLLLPDVLLELCGGIDLLASMAGMLISSGYIVYAVIFGTGVVLLLVSKLLQVIKVKK